MTENFSTDKESKYHRVSASKPDGHPILFTVPISFSKDKVEEMAKNMKSSPDSVFIGYPRDKNQR